MSTKQWREKNKEKIGEYRRNWYKTNSGEKERLRLSVAKRRADSVGWFNEYKETLKCEICGESHSACLEFHHTNPENKGDEISNMVSRVARKELILAEIAKCQVLCSNCHRKLHWDAKKDGRPIENVTQVTKRPPKEVLQKLLWEIPTTKIAEQYGVSDAAVGKWARFYDLTKPKRGYWSKGCGRGVLEAR